MVRGTEVALKSRAQRHKMQGYDNATKITITGSFYTTFLPLFLLPWPSSPSNRPERLRPAFLILVSTFQLYDTLHIFWNPFDPCLNRLLRQLFPSSLLYPNSFNPALWGTLLCSLPLHLELHRFDNVEIWGIPTPKHTLDFPEVAKMLLNIIVIK